LGQVSNIRDSIKKNKVDFKGHDQGQIQSRGHTSPFLSNNFCMKLFSIPGHPNELFEWLD